MSVHRIPLFKEQWRIYAIVCESSEQDFVVKIGVTSTPYERYQQLLCGIPFESVMLHAVVGYKNRAYGLETQLHRLFADRHMRGEWFRFKLEDKEAFHETMRKAYLALTKGPLRWSQITPEQVAANVAARMAFKKKYGKARKNVEWKNYRNG